MPKKEVCVFIWRMCFSLYRRRKFRPLKISRTVQNVRVYSREFHNITEHNETFWNFVEYPGITFWNNSEKQMNPLIAVYLAAYAVDWNVSFSEVQRVNKNKQWSVGNPSVPVPKCKSNIRVKSVWSLLSIFLNSTLIGFMIYVMLVRTRRDLASLEKTK